jgi:hypothetical protein
LAAAGGSPAAIGATHTERFPNMRKLQKMLLGDKVVEIVARNRGKVLFQLEGSNDLFVCHISRLKESN